MLKGEFKLKNFLRAITGLSAVIKNDPSLPILGYVLLETQEEGLRLAATNLEAGISFLVRGKIEDKGSVCVPYKNFMQYFSSMEGETFILEEIKQGRVKIKSPNGEALFKAQSGEEFPFQYELVGKLKESFLGKADSANLRDAILKTAFSASNDESRPELCGVLFNFSKDKLEMASTNSYRLAETMINFERESAEDLKIIVLANMLKHLAHILADDQERGMVKIYLSENQVLFEVNNFVFTSRLIEGNYPEYKEIIPKELTTEAIIQKEEFSRAIKRVGLFTNLQSPAVKLIVLPHKGIIKIKAENSLLGSSYEVLPAKISGERRKVNYNYNYLLEGMSHLQGEQLIFKTSGPDRPGLFLSEKDKDYLYMVMPIREA